MDNENGLDSEDEFEIDCALLSGREVEIRFVAPLTERVDEPRRRKPRRKRQREENPETSNESGSQSLAGSGHPVELDDELDGAVVVDEIHDESEVSEEEYQDSDCSLAESLGYTADSATGYNWDMVVYTGKSRKDDWDDFSVVDNSFEGIERGLGRAKAFNENPNPENAGNLINQLAARVVINLTKPLDLALQLAFVEQKAIRAEPEVRSFADLGTKASNVEDFICKATAHAVNSAKQRSATLKKAIK
eukprot:gene17901-biopygen2728